MSNGVNCNWHQTSFFAFSWWFLNYKNLITDSSVLPSRAKPLGSLKTAVSQQSVVWVLLAFSGRCHHKSNQSYNRALCVFDDGGLWISDRQASAMATLRQTMSLSSVYRVGLHTRTLLKQRAFIWYPTSPNPQASGAVREVPSTFPSSGPSTAASG